MPGKLTKAVILARGLGTRMQREAEGVELDEETKRAANAGMKAMIPVEGRPFLDYGIQELLEAGLSQICLVIGPSHDTLRNYYAGISARAENFTISFAYQEHADGTAKAVAAAREFVGEDEFIVVNCDNLYSVRALTALREAPAGACYLGGFDREAMVAKGNIERERIAQFAAIQMDENFNLLRIVEKPPHPEDYLVNGKVYVSMNLFRFTPHIFIGCDSIDRDPVRGEYELPTAVQFLLDNNIVPVKVVPVAEGVFDLTSKADIAPVRQMLQERKLSFA
jgi:glucose-1-phosphate thymidylyltransferase